MHIKTPSSFSRALAIGLVLSGWVTSGYLFFRTTQLNKDQSQSLDLCSVIFGSTCDEVLVSNYAWQLWTPVASWGLIYFGLLGLLLVVNKPIVDLVILLLTAFGFGVSIILSTFLITKGLSCPLCLGVHSINLLVLLAISLSVRPQMEETLDNQDTSTGPSRRWLFNIVLAIIIGSLSEISILANSIGNMEQTSLNQAYKDFLHGSVQAFSKNDLSPTIGPVEAPLKLVVYSSFQCPACQTFNQNLSKIRADFGEKLCIEYKNFPLSTSCNARIKFDMQPRSCAAALAAIAAHNQGKYWQYHDQLFQSNLQADEATLKSLATSIGLDIDKFESDRQAAYAKAILSEDIEIANQLGVNGTPSVFLNGRKVSNFAPPVLNYLLRQELERLPGED